MLLCLKEAYKARSPANSEEGRGRVGGLSRARLLAVSECERGCREEVWWHCQAGLNSHLRFVVMNQQGSKCFFSNAQTHTYVVIQGGPANGVSQDGVFARVEVWIRRQLRTFIRK